VRILLVVMALSLFVSSAAAEVEIKAGSTREDVISALGEPQGSTAGGNEEVLLYPGGMVVLVDGKVTQIDRGVGAGASAPMSGKSAKKPASGRGSPQAVKAYKQGGKKIDIKSVLIPGKVTVVDFYADWCGPCRAIAPHLEALAKEDAEVFLRKIDIVNWGTEVVKQYSIRSVPNIRVYDRNGNVVGSPTSDLNKIKDYIKQAK